MLVTVPIFNSLQSYVYILSLRCTAYVYFTMFVFYSSSLFLLCCSLLQNQKPYVALLFDFLDISLKKKIQNSFIIKFHANTNEITYSINTFFSPIPTQSFLSQFHLLCPPLSLERAVMQQYPLQVSPQPFAHAALPN
jgi:hypothetical protein